MRERTRAKWVERVREWRASGMAANEFADGKDFTGAGLRWAEARLAAAREAGRSVDVAGPRRRRIAKSSVARSSAPQFVPVRVRAPALTSELVVEVGTARIRVSEGFSRVLLGDVVRALVEGGL